jgi:hypothetical protein
VKPAPGDFISRCSRSATGRSTTGRRRKPGIGHETPQSRKLLLPTGFSSSRANTIVRSGRAQEHARQTSLAVGRQSRRGDRRVGRRKSLETTAALCRRPCPPRWLKTVSCQYRSILRRACLKRSQDGFGSNLEAVPRPRGATRQAAMVVATACGEKDTNGRFVGSHVRGRRPCFRLCRETGQRRPISSERRASSRHPNQ